MEFWERRLRPEMGRVEGESNDDWCDRMAKAIPPEALIKALACELANRMKLEPWSAICQATSHGSGVAKALARLYRMETR